MTHSVAHDGELMQTGLSVEEDETAAVEKDLGQIPEIKARGRKEDNSLSVNEMPLDRVSDPEPVRDLIPSGVFEEPLDTLGSTLLNEVGSRPDVASRPDGFAKALDVVVSDLLRVGELDGDSFWDGELSEKRWREGLAAGRKRQDRRAAENAPRRCEGWDLAR